jgi:hypothetical protein
MIMCHCKIELNFQETEMILQYLPERPQNKNKLGEYTQFNSTTEVFKCQRI